MNEEKASGKPVETSAASSDGGGLAKGSGDTVEADTLPPSLASKIRPEVRDMTPKGAGAFYIAVGVAALLVGAVLAFGIFIGL